MSLFDTLIAVLAPHDCLLCGAEGSLLCSVCSGQLQPCHQRCYRCMRDVVGSYTCGSCFPVAQLRRVAAVTLYEATAKKIIWKLKSGGTQSAATTMAILMTPLVLAKPGAVIVSVPTATSRIRMRGYDQTRLLARELSRLSGRRVLRCLVRSGQAHQVGASRNQRLAQLSGALRVSKPGLVRGKSVILVDDVITTGASLEAAARVLRDAGAVEITAVVFAQTKKDGV